MSSPDAANACGRGKFVHDPLRPALSVVPSLCDNGALLCERHHTAVHEGGFAVVRDPGTAVWHTYRPDGSEIRIRGSSP
jgi:hypothetical protein